MKNYLKFTGVVVATVVLSNVAFGYGIAAQGVFEHGHPVHELITRKAAVDAKFITHLDSYQMNNLIEGVRYNDDPETLLNQGNVLGFAAKFLGDNKGKKDPTEAVHFGNFQFLHAMAKAGMPANKVKNRMMLYAYHCWMMASDNNSYTKFKLVYDRVAAKNKAKVPNSEYTQNEIIFKDAVKIFPKEILFFNTDNQNSFQNRALGSLLHMIQDSYAKGHTVRVGFDDGSNAGDILYFQDYKQQDSHQHEALDIPKSGKLDEASLSKIPGLNMAYLRTKQVLEMAAQGCPWSSYELRESGTCKKSVYSFLSEEVFAISKTTSLDSRITRAHKALHPVPKPTNGEQDIFGNN